MKQHLAAIRMLFDWLVTGGVLATNPAHAVRGPKHVVKRGKTPVLTADQARALIESIDTSTLVGLRDRALIGVMTYAFARIGAVVAMRGEDYFADGKRWWVRLHEKGGKRHEMPAHHKLEAFLDEYIKAAGIGGDDKTPLFRSAAGRTGTLTVTAMNRVDAWRMIQRRAAELGTKVKPIFNSDFQQVIEQARQFALARRRGTTCWWSVISARRPPARLAAMPRRRRAVRGWQRVGEWSATGSACHPVRSRSRSAHQDRR